VAPADEGELVAAVRGALELIYKDKLAEAAKAIAAARKRWPKAAGPGGALCDLELRKNRIAQAKAECERALAIYPDASWPRYLLGIIALRGVTGGAKLDPGLAHLRGAIASDPDLGQAWRALGKALARGQRDAELAQLRIDYQARFGQALE
jgi:predicted Zn-dependent protease